ncbi:MAG: ABC transporter ATP-binding protein [Bacteroidales bacterium]|jgi:iron complex transport system ATP-binding protein|nr:ABC transporter ATP-binding protein [Bacteroidales bacterium]
MSVFFNISNYSCGYTSTRRRRDDDAFCLHDVNFSVNKGTFAGIIGPNGSGKTTLFRGISGLLPALSGSMEIEGKQLSGFSLRERARHIAVVTQTVDAVPLRVEEYVLMGRLPYYHRFQFFDSHTDISLARRYMEQTDVIHLKDKLMTELSGGEQQRAAIARALTQEPSLLLLDEPTAHLDITHQVRILNLISHLNDNMGLTVLMVIHDLNLASEYCEQLLLFNHGRVHTSGTPADVINWNTIEQVYQTPVVTRINPYSGKPVVFLVSEKNLGKR